MDHLFLGSRVESLVWRSHVAGSYVGNICFFFVCVIGHLCGSMCLFTCWSHVLLCCTMSLHLSGSCGWRELEE